MLIWRKGGALGLFIDDGGLCGIEHSYAADFELDDQALLRVYADAIAGELFAVIKQGYAMAKLDA